MGKPFPYNVEAHTPYGAPMGRLNEGAAHDDHVRLRLRRVPISQGYDGGGVYWGYRPRGVMLFCAWSADREVVRYLDARSYPSAEQALREDFPQTDFL